MADNNIELHLGDNLKILKEIKANSIDLIYIDPPFNTGKVQSRTQIKTTRSDDGDRIGFEELRGYSDTRVHVGASDYCKGIRC